MNAAVDVGERERERDLRMRAPPYLSYITYMLYITPVTHNHHACVCAGDERCA